MIGVILYPMSYTPKLKCMSTFGTPGKLRLLLTVIYLIQSTRDCHRASERHGHGSQAAKN